MLRTLVSLLLFVRLAHLDGAVTHKWKTDYTYSPDSMPIIGVKLAPPTHPMPEVTAYLGEKEKAVSTTLAVLDKKIEAMFEEQKTRAEARLHQVIDQIFQVFNRPSFEQRLRSSSFEELGGKELSVKVNVLPVQVPKASIVEPRVEEMDAKRLRDVKQWFGQVGKEMESLTDIVAWNLEAHLTKHVNALLHALKYNLKEVPAFFRKHRHVGFFERMGGTQPVLPSGLQLTTNVRLSSSDDPFPMLESLVEEHMSTIDVAESSLRDRTLELQLKLLRAENDMIESWLAKWMEHITKIAY